MRLNQQDDRDIKKMDENENKLKDFRLGKAGEEIGVLKQRVKELTNQLRKSEEIHLQKSREYEAKIKSLISLYNRLMEYCVKLSSVADHVFKLKEIDITENQLKRILEMST